MKLAHAVEATERRLLADERSLDDGLLEDAICRAYLQRFKNPDPPLGFRLPTVATLLAQGQAMLRPRRVVVAAQVQGINSTPDGASPANARITTGGVASPEDWTSSQVYAVRFWGIDIRPTEDRARRWTEELVWQHFVTGLASDLVSIGKIEKRFGKRMVDPHLVLVADREGEAFERLIVDILNNGALRARLAPLYEDFLEKTDLRVHVEGLQRQRGARVQVTMADHERRASAKRHEIRAPEEFVHLSPWTLAEALVAAPFSGLLPGDLGRDVYPALSVRGNSTEDLARSLRHMFRNCIRHPGEHPRGPVAQVPAAVQLLVQAFVGHEVRASTAALRAHEAERARQRPGEGRSAGRAGGTPEVPGLP